MKVSRSLVTSHVMHCAAVIAAALAATGCAAPTDPPPEPVAQGAAQLEAEVALGLVQLFNSNGELVGYSYTEALDERHSLQRFLLFSNEMETNLTFRAYDHDEDPAELPESVAASLPGWGGLVAALWNEPSLGAEMIYAVCISDLYEHGGIYDNVSWRALPGQVPNPAYPAWTPTTGWHDFTPAYATPHPSPLVWPPTDGWLQANAPPPNAVQLDPGDGKVWQGALDPDTLRGRFFSQDGVGDKTNAEYFFMDSSYQPAGAGNATRHVSTPLEDSEWPSLELFWDSLAEDWDAGTAVAINGCVNYQAFAPPTPL